MSEIRKEILQFALQMEGRMKANDKEKGDSWKTRDLDGLGMKFYKAFRDFREIVSGVYPGSKKKHSKKRLRKLLRSKLVDIGNLAMMLHHRLGAKK